MLYGRYVLSLHTSVRCIPNGRGMSYDRCALYVVRMVFYEWCIQVVNDKAAHVLHRCALYVVCQMCAAGC